MLITYQGELRQKKTTWTLPGASPTLYLVRKVQWLPLYSSGNPGLHPCPRPQLASWGSVDSSLSCLVLKSVTFPLTSMHCADISVFSGASALWLMREHLFLPWGQPQNVPYLASKYPSVSKWSIMRCTFVNFFSLNFKKWELHCLFVIKTWCIF